jgi:hypothetical protein
MPIVEQQGVQHLGPNAGQSVINILEQQTQKAWSSSVPIKIIKYDDHLFNGDN